jgi:hypothetical protein
MQWNKTIGGAAEDAFYTIIRTSDGGYAMSGWTYSYGAGGFDFLVVKLDASGNLQWTKVIGGSNTDYGCSIVQTSDGGYVVAGHSKSFSAGNNNDILVTKLSSSGAVQWSRTVGWAEFEYGFALIKTSDGGFAVAGSTESYGQGNYDLFIVKFNSNGIPEWGRMIGGANYEAALSLIQSSDGNYVVAGSTMSFGAGNYDMYIVKFGSSGNFMWSRTLGGSGYEFASSVAQTTDGGYIVTGVTESFGSGSGDVYVAKLSSTGSVQWQKTAGGSNDERGYSVVQTTDGGYSVAGFTKSYGAGGSDVFVVKFSSNGNTCGNYTTPAGSSGSGGVLISILPLSSVITPTVTSPAPVVLSSGTATALCTVSGIELASNEIPSSFELSQNYPNPFNPVTNIKFSVPQSGIVKLAVYDIAGKEVGLLVNQNLNSGTYNYNFDASELSSGVYFYRLTAEGFTDAKKMILVK